MRSASRTVHVDAVTRVIVVVDVADALAGVVGVDVRVGVSHGVALGRARAPDDVVALGVDYLRLPLFLVTLVLLLVVNVFLLLSLARGFARVTALARVLASAVDVAIA
eukprot:5065053-Alexandrium_andersonii.AAC.1